MTVEPDGGDPVDAAVLGALADRHDDYEVLDFDPFDADRKRAEARVREAGGEEYRVAKGAVQAILDLCGPDDPGAARVERATAEFAAKGRRALAVARADDGDWRLTGVLAIADPPREDSRATIERARALGVEVKMVTGDRVEIAREIARRGRDGLRRPRIERDRAARGRGAGSAGSRTPTASPRWCRRTSSGSSPRCSRAATSSG